MEGTTNRIEINPIRADSQTVCGSSFKYASEDIEKNFWQLWTEYRDHLYRSCLKWMNGNQTDAEDALSRAMLKAWEKVQERKYVITNFPAWLSRLTCNLCLDIHRECNRGTRRIESLEAITEEEGEKLASPNETPVNTAIRQELDFFIGNAIDHLPPKLRQVFILYFHQDQSYREIAQQLSISYDNVCKRISQARAILRQQLSGYVNQEEIAAKPSKSQEITRQKPVEKEALAASIELAAVSLVADKIPQESPLSVPQIETVIDPANSEQEIRENIRNACPIKLLTPRWETWETSVNLPYLSNPPSLVTDMLRHFQLCWQMWADSGGFLLFFLCPISL